MAVKPRPDYWGERLALSQESRTSPAQSDLRRGLRLGLGGCHIIHPPKTPVNIPASARCGPAF